MGPEVVINILICWGMNISEFLTPLFLGLIFISSRLLSYADPCLVAPPFLFFFISFYFLDCTSFVVCLFLLYFLSFLRGVAACSLPPLSSAASSHQLSHLFAEFSEFSPIYFSPLFHCQNANK